MRRKILLISLFLFLIQLGSGLPKTQAAPAVSSLGTASETINAINQYRQQNGLPALQIHSLLTNLAQSQANYQASIGTVTHTGPGGTTPKDRALAAGYGGGNVIFIS